MSSDTAIRRAFAALAVAFTDLGLQLGGDEGGAAPHRPFDFTAVRTPLGAASLFAVMLIRGTDMKLVAARDTILLGLVQTAAFTALIQTALVTAGAGKTAVLVHAMPFWLFRRVVAARRADPWPAVACHPVPPPRA